MSSILKALRKIEEEKRETKQAAPDLRVDQGLSPFKTHPLLLVSAGGVVGAVLVGLFFVWSPDKPASVAISQPVPETEQVNIPRQLRLETPPLEPKARVAGSASSDELPRKIISPDRSSRTSVPAVEIPVVILPSEPVAGVKKLTDAMVPAPVKEITAAAVVTESVPDQHKTRPPATMAPDSSNKIQAPRVPAKKAVFPVVSAELPEGVSLLVTEIFFHDDSALSMAVVNDLPVMVGTHVDSAVVTGIRPDSVLFSIGDMTYIVSARTP